MISRKLLGDRPRLTYRPDLHQGVRGLDAIEFSLENGVLQINDELNMILRNNKKISSTLNKSTKVREHSMYFLT